MNIQIGYAGVIFIILSLMKHHEGAVDFKTRRESHQSQQLTKHQLIKVADQLNTTQFRKMLNFVLIPRVVGTDGHVAVKQYIEEHMRELGWEVEQDVFTDNTPIGRLEFTNIIATLNPQASRFLVLACHYDSMLTRTGKFVGATDSAVPCTIMLDLATAMAEPLNRSKSDISLKLIFFDGEEAFEKWGPADSIYGSRHLASKLQSMPFPASNQDGTSELSRMDLLVLLDLIGAPNTKFQNFFRMKTSKWYNQLVFAEKRLAESHLLAQYSTSQKYFQESYNFLGIEDDHIPFMKRGVPILHLISFPFPSEWHTEDDNIELLDFDTIDNVNKIVRVFVAEYLKLDI